MKTELLNEYIFGKMVADIANQKRQARLDAMKSAGASKDEIANDFLSQHDIELALVVLDSYRIESLKALQASLSEPPK